MPSLEDRRTASGITRLTHSLAIAPRADFNELAEEFAQTGHVEIRGFLQGAGARDLVNHLEGRSDWVLAGTIATGVIEFPQAGVEAMSAPQRAAIAKLAEPSRNSDFRYLYERIWAADQKTSLPEPNTLLGDYVRLMSTGAVLDLIRGISGKQDVAYADGQATRYRPGHFLTRHNDVDKAGTRRLAYVLGLTEAWRPEWGGLLLFHNESGDIARGLVPRMNVLHVFSVPKDHSVSVVAGFASRARVSVSGWLRAQQAHS